jgi:hypothetical protein
VYKKVTINDALSGENRMKNRAELNERFPEEAHAGILHTSSHVLATPSKSGRSHAQKDVSLYYILGNPLLKSLEADPRCKAFLRKEPSGVVGVNLALSRLALR